MIDLNVLPVGKQFENLQKLLISSSCVAVKAPTGSGKSIGLPLMIMKKGLVGGQILVVQPRRIAAKLLARSVSKINGTQIGEEIGYQVRFENKSNPHTKIVYVTDGILLQKILHDSMLSRIGCVIFDEFHERSIQMDTSLALVHRLISNGRPSLKVVVTSATLDLKKIENYLPNCRSIELNSRIHPVEIVHRHTSGNEVPQIIDELSKQVDERDGDILIFMDGVAEIGKLVREIKKKPWAKGILVFPFCQKNA